MAVFIALRRARCSRPFQGTLREVLERLASCGVPFGDLDVVFGYGLEHLR